LFRIAESGIADIVRRMMVAATSRESIAAATKQLRAGALHRRKMRAAEMTGQQNRIMIHGPENDGTYVVEFRTADGKSLAISVPRGETAVLKRMPCGLVLADDLS
jgi:hypothetical protein